MKRKLIFICSAPVGAFLFTVTMYLSWYVPPSPGFNFRLAYTWLVSRGSPVVSGKDGWLFYRPGVTSLLVPWPEKNIDNIIRLNKKLLRDSVCLIVVPVPNKSDVYPESLGLGDPKIVSNQRDRFFNRLKNEGVYAIDLLPVFRSVKDRDTY